MNVNEVSRSAFAPMKASNPSKSSFAANLRANADEVVAEFRKEAKKTPMERLRENILKRHNLTEEQFAALPLEKRAPIQKEIEEAMKRAIKGVESGTPEAGLSADVMV